MKALNNIAFAKWIVAFLGIVAILFLLVNINTPPEPEQPPMETIVKSLGNTGRIGSYSYTIKMSTLIDGKEQLTSNISGERQSEDNIHFKGTIFDSEVDFYLIGTATYSKDYLTKEWIKNTGNQINQRDIFMQELNPLAIFSYKELNDVKYLGVEKYNGQKQFVYTAKPVVNNPYMDILWTDFEYKFWLEPKSLLVSKAYITATSKQNKKDKLKLSVEFKDYGENFDIKPPV